MEPNNFLDGLFLIKTSARRVYTDVNYSRIYLNFGFLAFKHHGYVHINIKKERLSIGSLHVNL